MTSLQRAAGLTSASSSGFASSAEGLQANPTAGIRRSRPGTNPNATANNTNVASNNNNNNNNNNLPKRGGVFEASFGGLDLSEFGAAVSSSSSAGGPSSTPTISAAAALLREKTVEAERTQREAEEEAIMQANAVALAQEQTKRLAAMKEKLDVEGRDNGRSNHLLEGGTVGGRARPADGMEFLGQGMFSTLVHMHGNDDHGAKREGSNSVNAKSSVSAVRSAGTTAKSSKLADAVASKQGGASSSASKRIPRLAKISSKKSPSSAPNKGGLVGKKNQRSKGAIKKGKRSKF